MRPDPMDPHGQGRMGRSVYVLLPIDELTKIAYATKPLARNVSLPLGGTEPS